MKVIGLTEVGDGYNKRKAYVAIISHDELLKVADKSHYGGDQLKELNVGEDYQISSGHDFRRELSDAIRRMQEAYTAFAKVAPIAAQFAGIVGKSQPIEATASKEQP